MNAEIKKTILLVEDEAIIALAEKLALERHGYEVIIAHNDQEAVAAVEKTPAVDLILMDVNLGAGLDGTETAALILKQRDIPVVFLSSHTEPEIVEKTENITSYGYVVKSSSQTVLDASIKMAFKLFEAKTREKEKEARMEAVLEDLRRSEERYSLINNSSRDSIYSYNALGRFSSANRNLCELLKLEERQIIGHTHAELGFPESECREWADLHRRVYETGHTVISETATRLPNGNIHHFEVILNPLHDMDGNIVGIGGTTRDITTHKQAETELFIKSRIQQALNAYSYQVEDIPYEELYPFVIKRAREIFPIKHILLSRYDETGRRLVLEASSLSGAENGMVAKLLGRAALGSGVQVDSEMHAELLGQKSMRNISLHEAALKKIPKPVCRLIEKALGVGGFHGASMVAGNRLIGALMLIEHPDRIFAQETELLSFAAITANAMMRKKAEAALRLSEEKYRTLIENSHDILFTLNLEGILLFVSPSWTAILGHPLNQVVGKAFSQFVHADDLAECMALMRKVFVSGQPQEGVEYRVRHADGAWRWHITNAVPLKDAAGIVVGGEGIARDITVRKEAELQKEMALTMLRANEQAMDDYQEIAKMGSWELDLSNGKLIWSKNLYKIFGHEPFAFEPTYEGFLGQVHPVDRPQVNESTEFMSKTRNEISQDLRFIMPDGSAKWVHNKTMPVFRENVLIKLKGISLDISERKRAEEALQESKAQLANALQMAKAGHWEYDVDSDLFTFNDNFFRIFRTTAAAAGGDRMSSADYARKFCHPDDMAMVGDETRKAVESSDPNYSRQIEHRILYADGQVGYIAVRFFISKNPQGRTVKTYGVNQDITWRKLAEDDIKRQLAEKEILLKEVHHRIKNNIAAVGSLISLRLRSVVNPEAAAVLQDAVGRIDSMRILYDKLLFSAGFQDISVNNYVASLADAVVALFPDKARIRLDKRIADFPLDAKRLFPIGIIINELLTNTMKYAFTGGEAGRIRISLTNVERHVTLMVEDDGQGLPAGFDIDRSKGFGLMLVKMLCQQLGGSFKIESQAGTRSIVEFDI